jgi:hypothetical protein
MNTEKKSYNFIFKDNRKITLSSKQVLNISPSFYNKYINKESKINIDIPSNISYETFKEFIKIMKEQNSNENKLIIRKDVDLIELVQLSEFLENDNFSIFLINEYILFEDIKINKNNAYILLILSFNKLNKLNVNDKYSNEEDIENVWLELFLKSLEIVGKNLLYFFEEEKLDIFDKKIIDELFEKYFMNLILYNHLINIEEKNIEKNNVNKIKENINNEMNNKEGNNIMINKEKLKENSFENKIINNENKKENIINLATLRKMIEYLMNRRTQNSFFSLLSNEYMKISSEESLSEINNLPNPTFLLKLDINDIDNYYEEFEIENHINNNEQKTVLILNYKKIEDSFNISLKLTNIDKSNNKSLKNNNFDILTFLTSSSIEEMDIRQNNIKSISNNKSKQEIFKINNFSKSLSFVNNKYLTLKIYLKPCYTHSMLCNYLFYDFDNIYNNKNIYKINKNLLNIIIRKKIQNNLNKNMDKIVICLLNWLDNEMNIREDISEIIENIVWNDVSLFLLFEFIIKCAKNISDKQLNNIFMNAFKGRSKNYKTKESFEHYIIQALFKASRNIDYINLFCENIKLNKFNSYEIINNERITQNDNMKKTFSENNKNIVKYNSNKNLDKIDDNDSLILNNCDMKHNKSTSNLHYIKIDNSKKNEIILNITKYNITNSSKEKSIKQPKKISNIYSNNNNNNVKHNRNKTLDLKLSNSNININNKTAINTKKVLKKYNETSNNINHAINRNSHNKINIKKEVNNNKMTNNKISLITELNKLKLKVKANNQNSQIFQKNRKQSKNK